MKKSKLIKALLEVKSECGRYDAECIDPSTGKLCFLYKCGGCLLVSSAHRHDIPFTWPKGLLGELREELKAKGE